MSYNLSWIAIRGLTPTEALDALDDELGRKTSGETLSRRACLGELPGGWLLIVAPGEDALKERFLKLMAGRDGIACAEFETTMYSEAAGYEDGRRVWRVVHDPDRGGAVTHLHVEGEPPADFLTLKARALQEQEGDEEVDYTFDVPPLLAKSICGVRAEDYPPELVLRELVRAKASPDRKPGFLARLLGRG